MFHFLQRLGFLAVPFPLPSLKLCVVLPAIKLSASGSPGGSEGQGNGHDYAANREWRKQ